MPWSVKYLQEHNVVETIIEGVVVADDVRKAIFASLELSKEHDTYRYLVECLRMSSGGNLFDVYEIGKLIEQLAPDRNIKEAVIIEKSNPAASDMQFFETVTVNRGFNVRLFENRASALDWLVG